MPTLSHTARIRLNVDIEVELGQLVAVNSIIYYCLNQGSQAVILLPSLGERTVLELRLRPSLYVIILQMRLRKVSRRVKTEIVGWMK